MLEAPRYCPHRSFPRYAFVPGHWPHPTRSPEGHSFGHGELEAEVLSEEEWMDSEPYLFGVDLFNHGYYWEAHEQWECLWHGAGRSGGEGLVFKGLIKLAAASVKLRQSQARGVRLHCSNGARHFRAASEELETGLWCGLCFRELLAVCEGIKGLAGELSCDPTVPVERVHGEIVWLHMG